MTASIEEDSVISCQSLATLGISNSLATFVAFRLSLDQMNARSTSSIEANLGRCLVCATPPDPITPILTFLNIFVLHVLK